MLLIVCEVSIFDLTHQLSNYASVLRRCILSDRFNSYLPNC